MTTSARRAKELNETIRYTMWSVFKLRDELGDADRATEAKEVQGCSTSSPTTTSLRGASTT